MRANRRIPWKQIILPFAPFGFSPLELAISNEIDRFSLAMDVIKRVPRLQPVGAHAMERFRNMRIACRNYAYEHGTDMPEVAG